MGSLNDIRNEILDRKTSSQDEIRRKYLKKLYDCTGRDTIIFISAFTSFKGPDIPNQILAVSLEDVQGFMAALHGLKNDKLDLILHSPGGSMEAAEQIVQYLRSKYNHIRAIIPQNAMSAATMIACACDEIVMGKHSAIGPIDPQITLSTPREGAFTAPAQAILDEFEQAKSEVIADPRVAPIWVTKIKLYPHGLLNICNTTLELAVIKVAEWLNAYMFKSLPEKEKPGVKIAEWLGDARGHKTHGRPISIKTAQNRGLKVTALEENQEFQECVLSVFHAAMVTFSITPCVKMIENQNGKGSFLRVEIQHNPPKQ